MSKGKPILIIVGVLVAVVGLGLLAAGAGLVWADTTQRDADGFYTSPSYELSSPDYAIATEDIDLGGSPDVWSPGAVAFRAVATPAEDQPLFLGIAADDDVDELLAGVAHSRLSDLGADTDDVGYDTEAGDGQPGVPAERDVWVASAQGAGTQTLTWDVQPGSWVLVVMNADGSPGVAATVNGGVDVDYLLPIGIGLLLAGLIAVGAAVALLIAGASGGAGTRREPTAAPAMAASAAASHPATYPVAVEARLDAGLSRWQWLVKWLLAIPHMIVLVFLWLAFAILTVVAGVAILFTGRYPRSIFDFNVGVMRWSWRVTYYAYGVLGTDKYPPFSLAADADYPAALDVAYPERLSRGLVLVKWWLLAIPHYLIVAVFTGGIASWGVDAGDAEGWQTVASGGLIGILVFFAAIALLVTARYPRGLFDLVMGLQRWTYRVTAYAALMTDQYPPFRLDTGGSEPTPQPAGPPEGPVAGEGRGREVTHA